MTTVIFRPEKCYPPRKAAIWFDALMLRPGSNLNLSDFQVGKLRSHPDFPKYQEWGAIEIVEPKTEIDLEEKPKSLLSTMNVDNAIKTIEGCHDIAQLEAWLVNEARVTIRRAINIRITEIRGGNE